jgi:hypothetical protein
MDFNTLRNNIFSKLNNNTLTRDEADEYIEVLIKKDKYPSDIKKNNLILYHNMIYNDVRDLCNNGFKLTIDQFLKIGKSYIGSFSGAGHLISDFCNGKEMYDYCVKNNVILENLEYCWYHIVNVPLEMIDFILNYNTSIDIKYNMLKHINHINYPTEYIEKLLTFYETNFSNVELKMCFDSSNMTFDQMKRYIWARYNKGKIHTGAWFFRCKDILKKEIEIDELFEVLLRAIEYNHDNNKIKKYEIYDYIDNIIFYSSSTYCYNKYRYIPKKVLLKILPKISYFTMRDNFIHYENISSIEMHKQFIETKEIPKIFKMTVIYEFFEKNKIDTYVFDKKEDINFLNEFHEKIDSFFGNFNYIFPERYDRFLIKNINIYLIIVRQLIMMFNMYSNQKINISRYVEDINDKYEGLSIKLQNKYRNDFNRFLRILAN